MEELIHREVELAELDSLLRRHWTHHVLNVSGFPDVGKTVLIQHWIANTAIPGFLWQAPFGTVEEQRSNFLRSWRKAGLPGLENVRINSDRFWSMVFTEMGRLAKDAPKLFVLDNLHLIIEQDPYAAGKLQAPADHEYPETEIILGLAGSDTYRMKRLLTYDAPLYGRFDLHLEVKPLPFPVLRVVFPEVSIADRVRIFAVIGGIPGYWHYWERSLNLYENIQALFFHPDGMLLQKAEQLIEHLARQGPHHVPILRAIARGATSVRSIQKQTGLEETDLRRLLYELEVGRWIRLDFIASLPLSRHRRKLRRRYEIGHPLLRVYIRFVEPDREQIRSGVARNFWARNAIRLDRLIAREVFPELCREWIWAEILLNKLHILPQGLERYWSSGRTLDVVAVDWDEKSMVLGKCVWTKQEKVETALRELQSWMEELVPNDSWTVRLVLFLGPGIHPLSTGAENHGLLQISIESLDQDLFEGDLERTERRLKAYRR